MGGGVAYRRLSSTYQVDQLYLNDSLVADNVAFGGGGGGLWINGEAIVSVSTFRNNTAAGGAGGGVSIEGPPCAVSLTTLDGCSLESNAAASGGGLALASTEVFVTGSNFTGNTAVDGGGIYGACREDGCLQFAGVCAELDVVFFAPASLVQGNAATRNGGGVYLDNMGSSNAVVSIDANTAGGGGGGAFVIEGDQTDVADSLRGAITATNAATGWGSRLATDVADLAWVSDPAPDAMSTQCVSVSACVSVRVCGCVAKLSLASIRSFTRFN